MSHFRLFGHLAGRLGPAMCLVISAASAAAPPAAAQNHTDPPGIRARGMGGAFVAVADDATAVFWNPGGLAGIGLVSGTLGWDTERLRDGDDRPILQDGVAFRDTGLSFAFGLPALALSYTSAELLSAATVATAAGDANREDPRTAALVRRLRIRQFGLTVAQSLGESVVVGSTLQLIRGNASSRAVNPERGVAGALDEADALSGRTETAFDADVGLMAYFGRLRVGVVGRHLARPTFDAGTVAGVPASVRLDRSVRAGIAVGPDRIRSQRDWTVSFDADLTTVADVAGRRRGMGLGLERWWWQRRFALRGGGEWQTVDDARGMATGGASVALAAGVYVDAYVRGGSDDAARGWGVAARFAY